VANAKGAIVNQQGHTRQIGAANHPQVLAAGGFDSFRSISGNGYNPADAPNILLIPGVSPAASYVGELETRQLIYDFNQTRNLVRQSESLEGVAESNLTRTQFDLVLNVKSLFYAYASARRLVTVNEQNVANRQRQLDLTRARLRYELGLPSDVVTAESSKSQAVLALNQARDDAEQARINLLVAMGVNPLTPMEALDDAEPPPLDTDPKQLLARALRERPEIIGAEREVYATKYGLEAAKAVNLPTLFAAVAGGVAGNEFPLKDNSVSFSLGVNFPLIDGGQRAGAIQSARGQVTSAEADLQSATLSVRGDVASAYMGLKSVEQRVAIADAEVSNGREGVRVAEGRYSSGLGLFLDIITAQGLLLGAQTDRENVINALNQARARLRHAIGESLR
jgi:outer membrane protein